MDLKKMCLYMLLSWISLIELIFIWLLFKIFPLLIFIIIIVICFGYKVYQVLLIKKRIENGINADIGQENMRGYYYTKSFGKVIEQGDYMIPQLNSNKEVLIKVKSAALNPVDYKIQIGKIPFYRWFVFPYLGFGYDLSGEVIKIGSKVTKFKEGDKVFGFSLYGSFQEYAIAKESHLCLMPEDLNYSEAAALPIAACTSYQALVYPNTNNSLKQNEYENFTLAGKTVLVIGASGGTGHLGVQIARALGAKEVYGICSQKNVQKVQDLCVCNQVFAYDSVNFEEELNNNFKTNYDEPKLDIIYDTVSSMSDGEKGIQYKKYLKSPENGGFYIYINSPTISGFINCFCRYISPKLNFFGKNGEAVILLNRNDDKTLEKIKELCNKGQIKPLIQNNDFEYDSIVNSINSLKSRRTVGKLVFEITL